MYLHQPPFAQGRLIVDETGSRSRFIDNNLWSSVSGEFRDPHDAIAEESSDDDDTEAEEDNAEFLLGLTPSTTYVTHLHPVPEGMFKLWSLFLENVNPMTKIIHYPSLQEKLVAASQDIEHVPRGLEALMFSIYLCAVTSIDEQECSKLFSEKRSTLLQRYRQGARKALSRAKFLGTADLMVLQAFFLYLLMMREEYDSRTLWTLAGVANRIAQSMGIHRDGTMLGLPPFEVELRRRIWWQITILDFRSAELTGSGRFGDFNLSDTRVPANVDDQDIWPGMTESPVETPRATEMITCLLRCEFGAFWKEKLLQKGGKTDSQPKEFFLANLNGMANEQVRPSPWAASPEERDAQIDELQGRLQDKFLKHFDLTVPLQHMAHLIGLGAVTSMRLMAHHPRRWENENDIPASERKLLWGLSLKLLQGDNAVHATRTLKKFMWHTRNYFQWQAMVYLLGELRKHTTGEEVDAAWKTVDESWENHVEWITDHRRPLHVAVGSLCLKAYDVREKALKEDQRNRGLQGDFGLPMTTSTPTYIETLRQQRATTKRKDSKTSPSPDQNAATTNTFDSAVDVEMPPTASFGPPTSSLLEMPSTLNQFNLMTSNQFAYDPMIFNYDPNMGMDTMQTDSSYWHNWDTLIEEYEHPSVASRYTHM